MAHISVSEKRFLDGKGERYLKNGEVRCQGVAKSKLRLARIEQQNPDLTSDDIWPLGQCTHSAVTGTYLCTFHGGSTPSIKKKELWEFLPQELQDKYLSLGADVNKLMDRTRELTELTARKAELYEMLDELVLANDAYDVVSEADRELEGGNLLRARTLLRTVLMNPRSDISIHNEIREIDKLIETMTKTQFGMMKDLRDMATTDQVSALKDEFFDIVKIAIDKNVSSPELVASIYQDIFNMMSNRKVSARVLNAG